VIGRRILLLIPHPDDEVVGAALAIRRALAAGAAVTGLDLTHGVPPHRASAARVARRRREAELAARALGMARIADDGLPARGLLRALERAYRRAAAVVAERNIDTVWAPAYEGGHADHDAANALAAALKRAHPALGAWEFAEYNFASGRVCANEFPAAARAASGAGGAIEVAPADEGEALWKKDLLRLYRSERFNLGRVTVARARAGARVRECFRPLPQHDYARPPHEGRLFYARFHWVPLRLPQIDFTTSAEVSAAILAFLAVAHPTPAGA
jgi:LmbE family N-acetylglucosaminyl deacetylase